MADALRRGPLGRAAVGAALALLATIVAWALARTTFVESIELKTYDWRVRYTTREATPSDEIAIVSINEDSIRRMEPLVGRWPWPRLVHATLVDFLARGRPKLIVYDILFTEADSRRFTVGGTTTPEGTMTGGEEWTGAESDQAFAESIRKAGNVLLAADASFEGLLDESKAMAPPLDGIPALNLAYRPGECFEARPALTPPIKGLAASAAAIGHTFIVLDSDGIARRSVPFIRVGERDIPSLAIEAVARAAQIPPQEIRVEANGLRIGQSAIPLIEQSVPDFYGREGHACRALIPFRGPAVNARQEPTFRNHSFYDLFYSENQLLENAAPLVDPAIFKDRIVIVGASAAGTYDAFPVPYGTIAPGAHLHAHAIDALLGHRAMAPASRVAAVGATLLVAIVIGVAGGFVTPWTLAAVTAGVAAVMVWSSVQWFRGGLWTPMVQPLSAVGLAFVGQLAWQYFIEGREKRQVKRLFSRYVPKDIYEQLLTDPSRAALGGARRTMTVLFSDVRGFTSMSERSTPEEVVGQLNEYFSRMVQVLFEHRGTLDKFVGDMVMGLFGAPLDDPDHADHAVQAALAMTGALRELNQQWAAAGRPALDIGIGISTGEMVAGNIGSDTIMSYTVIGDTVNLGARLESLNKEYQTRIIISEATRAALKGRYDVRPLGEVVVKGKSRPVAIYEVQPS